MPSEPQLLKAATGEPHAGDADPGEPRTPQPHRGESRMAEAPPFETAAALSLAMAPPQAPVAGATGATAPASQPIEQAPREAHGEPIRDFAKERSTASPPHGSNGSAINGANGRNGEPTLRTAVLPHAIAAQPGHVGAANGDARRTLHLSLGGMPSSNGAAAAPVVPTAERAENGSGQPLRVEPAAARVAPPSDRDLLLPSNGAESGRNGSGEAASSPRPGPLPAGRPGNGEGEARRLGGNFIDSELRARVDSDIAAFLAAFDAALQQDSQESRSLLREATDRLLRAGARTRIELERLEARVPLTSRDNGPRSAPAWRAR